MIAKHHSEIEGLRLAGRLTADVLDRVGSIIKPGITTDEINDWCHRMIVEEQQAVPAPLNYHGFPKSVCTSVNHVVCHGIPGSKRLVSGDIINVDVTVIKDGWYGDSSRMFVVGEASVLAKRLVDVCRQALWIGINTVKAGIRVGDIGYSIQRFVEAQGFSVVREYCGHGLGRVFHEDPQILHYGTKGTGPLIEEGMIFTIEPMVNAGKRHVRLMPDQWTVVTKDHSLSAQWEHTLMATATGVEILTLGAGETAPTDLSDVA
jgi:methionyl aminopeptidase